jgi:integrase
MASAAVQCPQCGSTLLYRDGLRYYNSGEAVQRWLCRSCGYRFTDPEQQKRHRTLFYNNPPKRELRHFCDTENLNAHQKRILVEAAKAIEQREAGATEAKQADIKGKIIEFLWSLEKNGRSPVTIKNYRKFLNGLLRHGLNLLDPEEVKGYIAKAKWNVSSKITAVRKFNVWFRWLKIPWEAPRYTPESSIPFIPTETELDQLIASVGKKTAAYLQLLKETGARAGEISKLTWMDIDFEKRTIRIKPEKGSLPRILPLSTKAIEMLNNLPRKSEKIFPPVEIMEVTFRYQRNKSAKKLCNPRLQQITFKTFRHWKGTTEYHKTKDPIHVKQILGHKDLKSTQVYIHIENAIYGASNNDEFHVKVAKTQEEITELIGDGWEYVFTHEGLAYFRKRK